MKKTGSCPKCAGTEIRKITGENQSKLGIPTGVLSWVPVSRYICVSCGYLEEYVEGGKDLDAIAKLKSS